MAIVFWKKTSLKDEQRRALERWVRLRFRMLEGNPVEAVIGAVARLTGEGMKRDDAMATVAKILREEDRRVE